MEQDAPRQVPYDVDIEQALLGAILVDNYSLERVSNTLKAEHFYDPLHQRLYEAIDRMWSKGHAVTALTLKSLMEQDAGLAEVGGQAYLVSLSRAAPALPNVKDYARILADLAMRRELIRIGEDIVNAAFESPIDVTPAEQIVEAE
jgi:replicative DNA helicase